MLPQFLPSKIFRQMVLQTKGGWGLPERSTAPVHSVLKGSPCAPWAPCRQEPQGVVCILRLTNSDARVGVGRLHQLFALMANDPVGIDLSGALGVQVDHLEVPEVRLTDGVVLRTHVVNIRDVVVVKVVFAGITTPIACHQGQAEKHTK